MTLATVHSWCTLDNLTTMKEPPNIETLSLNDNPKPASQVQNSDEPDFMSSDDPAFNKLKDIARMMPFKLESNERMQQILDHTMKR